FRGQRVGEHRPSHGSEQRQEGHRQRAPPVDGAAARVGGGGRGGARDRSELVGGQRADRSSPWHDQQQRRQLEQTATSDDRVDRAGGERGRAQQQQAAQRHIGETGPVQRLEHGLGPYGGKLLGEGECERARSPAR